MLFDHVEMYVPDREAAVHWYREILGFTPYEPLAHWSTGGGPLMIGNHQAQLLALFEGPAQSTPPECGFRRVAFRVRACGFESFLDRVAQCRELSGSVILRDHELSLSAYFPDPFGNQLEVTCYEYERAIRAVHEVMKNSPQTDFFAKLSLFARELTLENEL